MYVKKVLSNIALISMFCFGVTAFASDSGEMADHADMLLEKQTIDGFTVTFHVMKAEAGKEMGGTHDFMIKVEKGGKVYTDITSNSKVVYPDGKSESKMMMKMGDWYMAGYDLGQTGKHQLMVLFKTADGTKVSGGVYYPHK